MSISATDKEVLRRLAERYAEIAHLDVQKERLERYFKTNNLEQVRPVVLISEVPWGEIKDEALANVCAPEEPSMALTAISCTWAEDLSIC